MVKALGCETIYLHPLDYTPKPRISLHVNTRKEVWKQVQVVTSPTGLKLDAKHRCLPKTKNTFRCHVCVKDGFEERNHYVEVLKQKLLSSWVLRKAPI